MCISSADVRDLITVRVEAGLPLRTPSIARSECLMSHEAPDLPCCHSSQAGSACQAAAGKSCAGKKAGEKGNQVSVILNIKASPSTTLMTLKLKQLSKQRVPE